MYRFQFCILISDFVNQSTYTNVNLKKSSLHYAGKWMQSKKVVSEKYGTVTILHNNQVPVRCSWGTNTGNFEGSYEPHQMSEFDGRRDTFNIKTCTQQKGDYCCKYLCVHHIKIEMKNIIYRDVEKLYKACQKEHLPYSVLRFTLGKLDPRPRVKKYRRLPWDISSPSFPLYIIDT